MKISVLNNEVLLREVVKKYNNAAQILEEFGLNVGSSNYVTLRKYCKKYNIDIQITGKNKRKRSRTSIENFFIKNSQTARHAIKSRIIDEKLIEYKCISCGLKNEWNNKKLSLQLEHINGINNDNRLENLAFICPNCHSQTSTYAGKNKIRLSQGG